MYHSTLSKVNTKIHIRKDINIMWLDNLKAIRKEKGDPSFRKIAEACNNNPPERTIARIFRGETQSPYVNTIDSIAKALDSTLEEVFADTKVVVATEKLAEVQEKSEVVSAENDILAAENKLLKDKVSTLTAEVDLLKMQLAHKEEIIAIHNYYNKRNLTEN